MTNPGQSARRLLLMGGIGVLISALSWGLYGVLLRRAPAQDFMVFYTAARAWADGDPALLFDGRAFTDHLNRSFADLLAEPLTLHPWVYPPLFLFVVVPLGLLPFALSCALFLFAGFVVLNLAMRLYATSGFERWLCFFSLLLSPATSFTIAVGQNAFLATALMVGGFGLLPRAPLLGGVLLGALTFKPQLWVLVPVALIAAGQWRALVSALATACALVLVSAAAFGLDPWWHWLDLMRGSDTQFQDWLLAGRLYGQSIFAVATLLGAPGAVAQAAQVVATLAGAALVWLAWRQKEAPADMRLGVLLVATMIAAPHVSNYDGEMLAVAVSLLLCRAIADGFRAGETAIIIIGWGIELLDPPKAIPFGLVTPLVLLAVVAALFRRMPSHVRGGPVHAVPAN